MSYVNTFLKQNQHYVKKSLIKILFETQRCTSVLQEGEKMANICKMWVIFDVSPTFQLSFTCFNYMFYINIIRIYAYAVLSTF